MSENTEPPKAGETPEPDIASDALLTDREAAANAAAEARAGMRGRGAARWTLRAGAALAAAGIGTATVLGAVALPEEVRVTASAPVSQVQPAAPTQLRVCGGDAVVIDSDDGQSAPRQSVTGEPRVAIGTFDEALAAGTEGEPIDSHATARLEGGATPLAAAQSVTVQQDNQRGFAASECVEPRLEQWLVGGSTRTGRQSVVTVTNASDVAASVNITVFGPEGQVSSVGSSGVAVAPRSAESLDLAGIAPDVADPVVRVASIGAPVAAHLQQTTTRTLERGGYDVVDPVPALTTAVVAGIEIGENTGVATAPDYDDATPVVRMLSTQGGAVRVTIRDGKGRETKADGELLAGRVTDFPLEDVEPGNALVRVESDAPVAVGARAVANDAEGLDFDWIAAGQQHTGETAVAVPDGPSPTLHIASDQDVEQTVTIDGEQITLPARGLVTRDVSPGTVRISGESFAVAVAYRGGGLVGGFTVSPEGPTASGLTVVH